MNEQKNLAKRQQDIIDYINHKAFLVAKAKHLSTTYVIEIHNQGNAPAKDVQVLIDDKPILKNPELFETPEISNIAPKDWITYVLRGNPPKMRFKVNISWVDDTNKEGKYENFLSMY